MKKPLLILAACLLTLGACRSAGDDFTRDGADVQTNTDSTAMEPPKDYTGDAGGSNGMAAPNPSPDTMPANMSPDAADE